MHEQPGSHYGNGVRAVGGGAREEPAGEDSGRFFLPHDPNLVRIGRADQNTVFKCDCRAEEPLAPFEFGSKVDPAGPVAGKENIRESLGIVFFLVPADRPEPVIKGNYRMILLP